MSLKSSLQNIYYYISNYFSTPTIIHTTLKSSDSNTVQHTYKTIQPTFKLSSTTHLILVEDTHSHVKYICKQTFDLSAKSNSNNNCHATQNNTQYETLNIPLLHNNEINELLNYSYYNTEYNILKNLPPHENIIKPISTLTHHNYVYTIYKYYPNGDILRYIQNNHIDFTTIECIFKQIVTGIHFLHSHNVIHRNLSLENLVISDSNSLKIIDFKTAVNLNNNDRLMRGQCGSSYYAAPEVYKVNLYDGKKVDIFAAGIILFALLIGYFPFKEARVECKSYVYFMRRRLCEHYVLGRMPVEIKELVIGMLDSDPKTRYSIEDVMNNEWVRGIDVGSGDKIRISADD